ncbi:MAG TPA: hypothetical protein VG944_16295 [Fimbriimonas sp.]|nr:hypothetical protein [Fimbriimonas sp.]
MSADETPIVCQWKETTPRSGWQILRSFFSWRIPFVVLLVLASVAAVATVRGPENLVRLLWLPGLVFLVSIAFLLMGVRRPLKRKQLLIDDPSVLHSCVHIEYWNKTGRFAIGTDVGVVTSMNGWLTFEGERSRFSVRHSDGATFRQLAGPVVTVSSGGQEVSIRFSNLPHSQSRPIRQTLSDWDQDASNPIGLACLPPTLPDLVAMEEDKRYQRAVMALMGAFIVLIQPVGFLRGSGNARIHLVGLYIHLVADLITLLFAFWLGFLTVRLKRRRMVLKAARVVVA